MNVIQALGVENSNQARAWLAAHDLCGCRIYGGRLVHIRHIHAKRSLCGKYSPASHTVDIVGWSFVDGCCRKCAKLALAVTDG